MSPRRAGVRARLAAVLRSMAHVLRLAFIVFLMFLPLPWAACIPRIPRPGQRNAPTQVDKKRRE